jgi:Flp pilus assembly protein TadD
MAEHGRTWEVELPDGAGPYELRIPLSGKPAAEAPTLADQQLSPRPEPKRSYLAAVAKIRELFAARRHELALIELGNAEADFPDDARLWAMKGTLYLQMGKRKLARTAWQKSLQLGPDDGVAQALRELGGEE